MGVDLRENVDVARMIQNALSNDSKSFVLTAVTIREPLKLYF
jgi:hypothetical protein